MPIFTATNDLCTVACYAKSGLVFRACLVASCFLGALPPVDLRAVVLTGDLLRSDSEVISIMVGLLFVLRETSRGGAMSLEGALGLSLLIRRSRRRGIASDLGSEIR